MLKIRAFRALDDQERCERFAQGHRNVLLEYGITKVTTSNTSWFHNPDVYVVTVESEDGSKIFGGERIHKANDYAPLPMEDAISVVDKRVYDVIANYKSAGTGELCGLWNSRVVAGRGFSQLLTKIGVSLARQISLSSLFVFCAPYTVDMCKKAGFKVETGLGNEGKFNYPKLDLVATALKIHDIRDLSSGDAEFVKQIDQLTEHPSQIFNEVNDRANFEVDLELDLKIKPEMNTEKVYVLA